MPVKIEIVGQTASEAMAELSGLFKSFSATATKAAEITAGAKPAAAAEAAEPPKKAAAKKAEKPAEPEGPTLADAQAKLKELGAATDFDTAKGLLTKFGVAKAQDLPPEKFQEWIDACDKLIKAKELE